MGHDDGKEGTLAWHAAKPPVIPDELLDQLLAGRDAQAALGKDGLLDELKRALTERALNAEMDHHLDGEAAEGRPNSRNGYGRKMLLTDSGKLPISVPRDGVATARDRRDARSPPEPPMPTAPIITTVSEPSPASRRERAG